MNPHSSPDSPDSRKQRIDQLLDLWEEARDRGESLSPTVYCNDEPQVVDELLTKIAAIEKIEIQLSATQIAPGDIPTGIESSVRESVDLKLACRDLNLHATGGLGVVYSSYDDSINRRLAVKFVRRGLNNYDEAIERLMIEARITGALDHPGVVPVYGIGQTESGDPFYVMRFVKGQTLAEAIEEFFAKAKEAARYFDNLEFRNLLTRFVTVCRTVAFAHGHGVLHRDLKPQNILLGRFGETLVADWGLACYMPDQEGVAEGSHVVVDTQFRNAAPLVLPEGTPAYMSPEQHVGCSVLTRESDVYALGVILFKLLTGQLPCEAGSATELKNRVVAGDVKKPKEARKTCPTSLARICEKAMSLEIDDRYSNASDIADDIEAYLGGYPSSVYREPLWMRLYRFFLNHRFTAYSLIVVALLLALLATWLPVFALSQVETRQRVQQLHRRLDQMALSHLADSAQASSKLLALSIDRRMEGLTRLSREADVEDIRERLEDSVAPPVGEPSGVDSASRLQAFVDDLALEPNDSFWLKHDRLDELQEWRLSREGTFEPVSSPMGVTPEWVLDKSAANGVLAHITLVEEEQAGESGPGVAIAFSAPWGMGSSSTQVGIVMRDLLRHLPEPSQVLQGRQPALMMLVQLSDDARPEVGLVLNTYQADSKIPPEQASPPAWRHFEMQSDSPFRQVLSTAHLSWKASVQSDVFFEVDGDTTTPLPYSSAGFESRRWRAVGYPLAAFERPASASKVPDLVVVVVQALDDNESMSSSGRGH